MVEEHSIFKGKLTDCGKFVSGGYRIIYLRWTLPRRVLPSISFKYIYIASCKGENQITEIIG